MKKKLLASLILLFTLGSLKANFLPAHACTWYQPLTGTAEAVVHYGTLGYPHTIAEYDASNYSLKLGVDSVGYASATVNGSMWVRALAQSSGPVDATLRWYIRGASGGGGWGIYGARLTVRFITYDETTDSTYVTPVLDEGQWWNDYGTWRETSVTIALYADHYYRFSLFASLNAYAVALASAYMDCGGLQMSDARIQWDYLNVPETESSPPPRLRIYPHTGGYTIPSEAEHYYDPGESVVVEAFPTGSYYFSRWILDGQYKWGNPITVTMDSNHDLSPRFDIGGGGGECPTLFVWDGADYVSEGVLPIHAESDITVQHTIQNTLALENDVYRLELRELDNYTSHLDQVRLYAVDDQGEWHLSPLLYADHNELGWVTWKLRFDDDNRVDMTPTQTIALRFLPSIPYSETAYFVFEINGCNRKALY